MEKISSRQHRANSVIDQQSVINQDELRRQMYERIARGHAISSVEEIAQGMRNKRL